MLFFHAIIGEKDSNVAAKYRQLSDILRAEAIKSAESGERKFPTEKEIAERFSVSRQTVRNALSILEEEGTIERLQGSGSYIKTAAAANGSKQIAVITTFIDDYIFPSVLNEAQRVFAEKGYSILLYATENNIGKEYEILNSLLTQDNISGILIEGSKTALPTPNGRLFDEFRGKGIPVLFFHGIYSNIRDFTCVMDDNSAGGTQLALHLLSKGHRKIGGIFKSDDIQGIERYYGVISALIDSGIQIDDRSFCWYDTVDRKEIVTGHAFLDKFIDTRLSDRSAIICYNDEIAYNLIQGLLVKGKRVPEDVSIVSFDNSIYSQIGPVPITSLGHKNMKTGKTAAEILLAMIDGKKAESVKLKWELYTRISG